MRIPRMISCGLAIVASAIAIRARAESPATEAPPRAAPPPASEEMSMPPLTEAQRVETARALEPYRERIRTAAAASARARRILFETIHTAPMDEAAVREAARRSAACEEELSVVRALVAQELRKILTPEQRRMMERMVKRVAESLERRAAVRGTLVDAYVEENQP
ncbi:MAG: hypothetical protein KBA51_03890 [Kiritimatiellae bacterium]|nr:hypothetical protein [Kiritimatiellia bacterium]